MRYLLDEVPDLSPEEHTIATELRQRWEREKAELRAEGRARAVSELRQRWESEKAELRAEGKAEAILSVLSARGFEVSDWSGSACWVAKTRARSNAGLPRYHGHHRR